MLIKNILYVLYILQKGVNMNLNYINEQMTNFANENCTNCEKLNKCESSVKFMFKCDKFKSFKKNMIKNKKKFI